MMKKLLMMLLIIGLIGWTQAAMRVGETIGIDFANGPNTGGAGEEVNFLVLDEDASGEQAIDASSGAAISGVTVDVLGILGTMGEGNIGYGSAGVGDYSGTMYSDLSFNDGVYLNMREATPNPLTITFSGLNDSLVYNLTGLVNGGNTAGNVIPVVFAAGGQSVTTTGKDTRAVLGPLAPAVINGVSTDGSGNIVATFSNTDNNSYFGVGAMTLAADRPVAYSPNPEDGDESVDPAAVTQVIWMSPDDPNITGVNGYDVYFGTDPNFVDNEVIPVMTESLTVDLDYETTYYWRVDSDIVSDGSSVTTQGLVWTFTTLPEDLFPVADAGADILTALEFLPASLAAMVDDKGENDIISVVWSIEKSPEGSNPVLTPGGTYAVPTAMLETDKVGDYTIQLEVTDAKQAVSDTLIVTVEADACAAAVAAGTARNQFDVSPEGGDCIVDLNDFSVFAAEWMDNINLTGQIEK